MFTRIKDLTKDSNQPLVIAGPCSAESEEQLLETAARTDTERVKIFRAGIWKPRTKPGSFEGIGAVGLKWLQKVKQEYGFLVATEVANSEHVKLALDHDIDVLWVGARSTANPFTVQEIAEALNGTKKIVLIKNPINPDLELWIGAVERFKAQNIHNLGAIHRGFSTYKKLKFRNNPHWQIPLDFMNRMPEIPMLCDPSHICGNREGLFDVAQLAFNLEYSGLMLEIHRDPDNAWSDAKQQITPERLTELLGQLELRKSDEADAIYHSKLNHLRSSIDDMDREILEAVTRRMDISLLIGELKKEHNVALYQSERWGEIKKNVTAQGIALGLSEEFMEKLIKAIHQESIHQQNLVMSKEKTTNP